MKMNVDVRGHFQKRNLSDPSMTRSMTSLMSRTYVAKTFSL